MEISEIPDRDLLDPDVRKEVLFISNSEAWLEEPNKQVNISCGIFLFPTLYHTAPIATVSILHSAM